MLHCELRRIYVTISLPGSDTSRPSISPFDAPTNQRRYVPGRDRARRTSVLGAVFADDQRNENRTHKCLPTRGPYRGRMENKQAMVAP